MAAWRERGIGCEYLLISMRIFINKTRARASGGVEDIDVQRPDLLSDEELVASRDMSSDAALTHVGGWGARSVHGDGQNSRGFLALKIPHMR